MDREQVVIGLAMLLYQVAKRLELLRYLTLRHRVQKKLFKEYRVGCTVIEGNDIPFLRLGYIYWWILTLSVASENQKADENSKKQASNRKACA